MARRPKLSKSTNLKQRILSAVILIPISLYIIYLGPPSSVIFGGIVCLLIFIEWLSLCLKLKHVLWKKMSCFILGTTYLLIAIIWLFSYLSMTEGWKLIYWILFLVWSTDILAFIGGKALNGPKLAPFISPNKTWAGFITGMIGGTIIGYQTSFWLIPGVFSLMGIMLLVLFAQLGDLLESIVKRWAQVKDSSFLIPGHGGFLDRLDSLIAVSFILALWQMFHV